MFSPTVLGSGISGYAFLTKTRETQEKLLASSGEVERDTQKFISDLNTVQTSDQLMDDRALLKVALGAFGLEADIDNKAFIQKVLDSDLTDGGSLANRLADKRYLALAQAFNFAGDGPTMTLSATTQSVMDDLAAVQSADDLLDDRSLLRATLATYGLEDDINNSFFLKNVLESDIGDPSSFANRLSDPRYAELAETLGFAEKARRQESIFGFSELVGDRAGTITTSDELFADPELLNASLAIFGLDSAGDDPDFLRSVLDSDLTDDESVANQLDDKRYAALAAAFGFSEREAVETAGDVFVSKLESFVGTVSQRTGELEEPKDLFTDIRLMLATFDFFDLPSRPDSVQFASRILESDRSEPTSLINIFPDNRYRAFADALGLEQKSADRVYPPGFAEGIVENYLERQFEIRVGETDPAMRSALALERELNQLIGAATSNDARWFGVMASKPMRDVFETALNLPSSFGTLDVDRQLSEFKARAEQFFGTEQVADFTDPERIEELRNQYLLKSQIGVVNTSQAGSIVLALLGGAQR